jgi:hypothetical protein
MPRRRTFTVLHWIADLLIDCEEDKAAGRSSSGY